MTLTLASSMLFSICIAKGLAMSKLGGVITPVYYAFNAWLHVHLCINLRMKLVCKGHM